jgi:hypothetical protein
MRQTKVGKRGKKRSLVCLIKPLFPAERRIRIAANERSRITQFHITTPFIGGEQTIENEFMSEHDAMRGLPESLICSVANGSQRPDDEWHRFDLALSAIRRWDGFTLLQKANVLACDGLHSMQDMKAFEAGLRYAAQEVRNARADQIKKQRACEEPRPELVEQR